MSGEPSPPGSPRTAPPTVPGPLLVVRERKNWALVMGIVLILAGLVGVYLSTLDVQRTQARHEWNSTHVERIPASPKLKSTRAEWHPIRIAAGIGSALLGIVLVTGGIGLLLRRAWTLPLLFAWACVKIVVALLAGLADGVIASAELESLGTQTGSLPQSAPSIVLILSAALSFFLSGGVWAIFVLGLLAFPERRAEMRAWKRTSAGGSPISGQAPTTVAPNPWVDRGLRSVPGAWLATIRMSLASPVELMKGTRAESSTARAFIFGVLTFSIYGFCGVGWWVMLVLRGTLVGLPTQDFNGSFLILPGIGFLVWAWLILKSMVIWPLVGAAFLMLWARSAHLILRMTGRTRHGYQRTAQALMYSAGTNVLSAVPCLSGLIGIGGMVWWAIAASAMLREGQEVAGWRARLSVAAFPVAVVFAVAFSIVRPFDDL